jgi:N-acetylmuramoyl-L-alanine amidase
MVGFAEPVDYQGTDGELTTYCKFSSMESFIAGYWHFIESGPYDGWEKYRDDGAGYIRHIARKGYAADQGYVGKVLSLFEEAQGLLVPEQVSAGVGGPTVVAAPVLRLAVIVGHNSKAQGASALPPIGKSEFAFNTKVAEEMKEEASHYNIVAEIFFRKASASFSSEIREAYAAVAAWRPDGAIELHFNSADNASASRSEVLCRPNDTDTQAFAGHVLTAIVDLLGLKNGGVKLTKPQDRGGTSLHALPDVPTILVEPFFGSNKSDCVRVASVGQEALALAYLRGSRDWMTAKVA